MYLTSNLNPLLRSEGSVPVAIFSLSDEQMFLPVSETYQDMVQLIIEGFALGEDVVLSLGTSGIDVCEGKEVKIHESAYTFLWKFLDKVNVTVDRAPVCRRQQKRAQKTRRSMSSIAQDFSLDFIDDTPTVPKIPGDEYSSDFIVETTSETPAVSDVPLPSRMSIPDVAGSSSIPDMTGGKIDPSETHGDDQHSDDQLEVPQEKVDAMKRTDIQPVPELEDKGEGGSNSQNRFKPAGAAALFAKSNKKDLDPPPIIKREKQTGSTDSQATVKPSIPSPPPTQSQDPRFDITIIGPKNELAQFKTRGKHPVRKVLTAACKTFGLKYEGARLVLSVSTEEGGEIQTDEFDCPREETMSQCGVDSNSKLFVRGEPDDDDIFGEE